MEETLRQLGFSEKQLKVYLTLLMVGSGTVSTIAKRAGVNRVTAYHTLETLANKGLVSFFSRDDTRYFVAENPERLLETTQERALKIQKLLPELLSFYKKEVGKPVIRYFEGLSGIRTLFFDSLHNNQQKQIFFLYPAFDIVDILGEVEVEEYVKKRIELGIHVKAIRVPGKEVAAWYLGSNTKVLREVRLVPEGVTFSMINAIYDNRVAFIFSKQENFGLLIESQPLAEVMKIYFKSLWKQCRRKSGAEHV